MGVLSKAITTGIRQATRPTRKSLGAKTDDMVLEPDVPVQAPVTPEIIKPEISVSVDTVKKDINQLINVETLKDPKKALVEVVEETKLNTGMPTDLKKIEADIKKKNEEAGKIFGEDKVRYGKYKTEELDTESVKKSNVEVAKKLDEGKITSEEFRNQSFSLMPIKPKRLVDENNNSLIQEPETYRDIIVALKKDQLEKKGVVGFTKTPVFDNYIKQFKFTEPIMISARLDIPSYNQYGVHVASLHKGVSGDPLAYASTVLLKDVKFVLLGTAQQALNIAKRSRVKPTGETVDVGKTTIARMYGEYIPHVPTDAKKLADDAVIKEPDNWLQIGMNPDRGSFFYDKVDGKPILEASDVIQIGDLVLAKGSRKVEFEDMPYIAQLKNNEFVDVRQIDEATKKQIKKYVFRLNQKDPSDLRVYEEGGFVKDQTKKLLQEGGLNQEGGTIDPVSGNDVPVGSTQEEVRDDIPAQLSEGEFVFPADVVRFIGLDNLMKLRQEAKSGLAKMDRMGQMGNSEEAVEDDTGEFDTDIDDIIGEIEREARMAQPKEEKTIQ